MIYANGQFVCECGKFSRHKENYKAAQLPLFYRTVSNENGVIELVIQVSNFTGGSGGIISPIYFGESESIAVLFRNALLSTAAILGSLLFIMLMNLGFWTFNRSKTTNLYFAILIFLIGTRQHFDNFNIIGLAGALIPFGIQFKLQNLIVFSGTLFCIINSQDKVYAARHPMQDKILASITFAIMILFACLPEALSMPLLNVAMVWAAALVFYAIYRIVIGANEGQYATVVHNSFYIIVATAIVIDHFWGRPLTSRLLYISEFATIFMICCDVLCLGAVLELLQKKAILLKNESSKYHISVRRFIPRNLNRITKDKKFSRLELGSSIEDSMTIMAVGFEVISPDNTQINLRDNFESMGFYSATIIDLINKRDGTVVSITSQGITAVFKSNSTDALRAAHEIRDIIQTVNARRAEDYYPCISFTISIHQCDALLGIVGDRTHIDFTIVSSGLEVTEKMSSLGFAMNIPVLISEPTIESLDVGIQNRLKLLGKIHFSEFTRPIGLYGFASTEEEETRLEPLDEAPFITQRNADKYINY